MNNIEQLAVIARRIREDVLEMTYKSGVNGGHLGGAFSSAEILAALYGRVLNLSPDIVTESQRDRFILSKGHTAIAHYAVLAECGFITKEEMMTFEEPGTLFPTHEIINIEKGIEISSGSLGYGLSIAIGIALSAKMKKANFKTYVLLGDGECNEGTVWEAAMAAAKYKLDKIIAIVDMNGQSLDGYTMDTMPICDMKKVWEGFGWNVLSIDDGNNISELLDAFNSLSMEKPNVLIAHTIKAKGIPSIEGRIGWHHARLTQEQYMAFKKELENVQ
ncbi:MAG: transketolase [Lachnospiraceae bacterium]|nr:transketolase [Lachnospiraceae bacterium]